MALPAGSRALVRAVGRCSMAFAEHGLLRRGFLPNGRPSSPEAAERSRAGFFSDELRSRHGQHEWHGVVFNLMLPEPGATRADSRRVLAACGKFVSRRG